jgi:hypothetical protein
MQKIFVILIIFSSILAAQEEAIYVRDIYLDRQKVFEKDDKDWFFAAPLLNALHVTTRKYVIQDELLFYPESDTDVEYILETERNLRRTGLFTSVNITIDSVGFDAYDVYITTKDKWSTYPALLYGSGGGVQSFGARLEEFNFIGTGTYISGEGLYRTENDIGIQGEARLGLRRFLRSPFDVSFTLIANKYRTDQNLSILIPYRTLDAPFALGVYGNNSYGSDFLYRDEARIEPDLMNFHVHRVGGYFSKAWWRKDRIFITGLLELEDVDRGLPEFRRAYDNAGKFLLQFSSVSRDFYIVKNVDSYFVQDMPIGGYGEAVLGKTFAIGSKGESLYYVGGRGEQSYYNGNLYLYGSVAGASGFINNRARYTYQDFLGLGFYKPTKWLTLATRIRQQTVWNWDALRQLVLDNDNGLRGYDANRFAGDNRIIGNFELRFFPGVNLWLFDLSGAAFYDVGSVWDQDTQLNEARFYSSIGAGLRFHFTKSDSPKHVFRIDFAYNIEDQNFGGIVFTTRQMFSAFGNHRFRLPELLGTDFDYE